MTANIEPETRPRRQIEAHEESYIHFLAREGKLVFRWGILIFTIVTALTMATFFFWAFIPGAILLLNIVLLVIADYIEQRTYHPGDPHDETAEEQALIARVEPGVAEAQATQKQKIEHAVRSHTARLVAGILVAATVLALAIAAFIVDRNLLILGGFIFFAYIILVAAPAWLGWLNNEAEDEAHRVEEEELNRNSA